jgi:hypothetical protein
LSTVDKNVYLTALGCAAHLREQPSSEVISGNHGINAKSEVPVRLNVDVPQDKGERPQGNRRANNEARDRVELGRRLMSFPPMSHSFFPADI